MKPIIYYNDKFLDKAGIFFKIGGIALFPFIILREKYLTKLYEEANKRTVNHETIHFWQTFECLIIPFYLLYFLFYAFYALRYWNIKKGYYSIPFEKEAFYNEYNYDYLKNRKPFSWVNYIFKPTVKRGRNKTLIEI